MISGLGDPRVLGLVSVFPGAFQSGLRGAAQGSPWKPSPTTSLLGSESAVGSPESGEEPARPSPVCPRPLAHLLFSPCQSTGIMAGPRAHEPCSHLRLLPSWHLLSEALLSVASLRKMAFLTPARVFLPVHLVFLHCIDHIVTYYELPYYFVYCLFPLPRISAPCVGFVS